MSKRPKSRKQYAQLPEKKLHEPKLHEPKLPEKKRTQLEVVQLVASKVSRLQNVPVFGSYESIEKATVTSDGNTLTVVSNNKETNCQKVVFFFSPNVRENCKYDRNPDADYDENQIDDVNDSMVNSRIVCQLRCYDSEDNEMSPNKYGKLNKFLYSCLAVGRFASLALSNNFWDKKQNEFKVQNNKDYSNWLRLLVVTVVDKLNRTRTDRVSVLHDPWNPFVVFIQKGQLVIAVHANMFLNFLFDSNNKVANELIENEVYLVDDTKSQISNAKLEYADEFGGCSDPLSKRITGSRRLIDEIERLVTAHDALSDNSDPENESDNGNEKDAKDDGDNSSEIAHLVADLEDANLA